MEFCHRLPKLKPEQKLFGNIKMCALDFQVEEIDEAGLPCSALRSLPKTTSASFLPTQKTQMPPNMNRKSGIITPAPTGSTELSSISRQSAAGSTLAMPNCPTKSLDASEAHEFLQCMLTPSQLDQLKNLSEKCESETSTLYLPTQIPKSEVYMHVVDNGSHQRLKPKRNMQSVTSACS